MVVLAIGVGLYAFFSQTEEQGNVNVVKNVNLVTNTNTASNTNTATDTSDWLTYENEEYGFHLKYPSNWETEVRENTSEDINHIKSFYKISTTQKYPDPEKPLDAYVSIWIKNNPNSETLQEMFDREYQECLDIQDNQYGCPGPQDTSDWKNVEVDGREAIRSSKINSLVDYDIVYVVYSGYFFVIHGSYYNNNYNFEPVFNQIILTLQFTDTTDTSDWQTHSYATEYHAFAFDLPEGWEVDESPAHNVERQGLLTAYNPEDDPGTAYFTMSFYNNSGTLSDWITEHKQELIRSHEDIIEDESDYSDSQRQVVMGEMKGLFKHAHCYVQGTNTVYEVYFFSELDNWEQYEDIFASVCSSFELIDTTDTSDWLTYEDEDLDIRFNYPNNYEAPQLIPGISGNADLPIGEWQDIVISLEDFWLSFTARDNYYGRYEGSWSNTFYSKTLELSKSEDEIKMVIKQDFNNLLYLSKEGTVVEFYELARYGSSYALLYRVMIPHEKYGMILGTHVIKQNYDTKIELDNGYLDEVITEAQGDVDSINSGNYDNEVMNGINELRKISSTITTID